MNVWLLLEPQDEGMIYPDQLYHHGIKGMHWGIRRFQPYGPGQKVKGGKEVGIATKVKQRVTGTVEGIKQHHAAKKEAKAAKKAEAERKAQVEHQLSKQQAIEKGTIEDLAKFKGELTNEEYGRAFARLQNEQRLEAMVAANQKTAWDTMDKGMEIVNKLAGYAGTIANAKNKVDAMSDALNRKKDKQKAEDELREKNKFLTNIHDITELNEGMDKHKITPQEYNAALNLLANKKLKQATFGSDFEDRNERAAREKAAQQEAANNEARAKMAEERNARDAQKAYEKAKSSSNVMDGVWDQSKAKRVDGMKWGVRDPSEHAKEVARNTTVHYKEVGTNKTSQLMLTMKDQTPSSYGSDKRSLKGAKSGPSGTVKNTGTMEFGDKTMLYKKSTGSDRKGYVQATRNAVDATQQERARQKEVDKKRKSALRHSALDLTPTELAHHGIKGQKWGVRRFQNKDGSRTKAGKDRAKFLRDRVKASRGGMVDDTWKTGSAALVARTDNDIEQLTKRYVGGVPHYASPSIVMRDFLRDTGDVPPDYKPMRGFTSFEEADLSYVNPDWGKPGTTQNCAKCAVATELMRYGVAVKAGRQAFPSSCDAMSYWFDGTEKVEKSLDDTEKLLASYGDGASGTIAGYYPNGAGGHAMHFSVSNGQVHVQDGQNGRHFGSIREAAETYGFDTNRNMHSFRLDTATPNWDHMAEDSVIGAPRWQSEDDRWRAKSTAPFRFSNNSDGTISNYDLTQESSNEIFRRHYT